MGKLRRRLKVDFMLFIIHRIILLLDLSTWLKLDLPFRVLLSQTRIFPKAIFAVRKKQVYPV